jgi:hypothetical protein
MEERRNRAEWESLIAEWDASRESAARFGAQRGIKPRTLAWWRWNLHRAKSASANGEAPIRLLPVDVTESTATADVANPASIEIALGDIALRIAVGTEPTYVASLIAALRARC